MFTTRFIFSFLFLTHLFFGPTIANGQIQPEFLNLGAALERDISSGETHNFKVKAEAGQAVAVTVEQQTVDVTVAAYDLSDRIINEAEFSYGEIGTERLFFVTGQATAGGDYRIEVRPAAAEAAKAAGRYKITLVAQRFATDPDRQENLANQKFFEGSKTAGKGTAESFKEAAKLFDEAAALWRANNNERGVAQALHYKTLALFNTGDRKAALAASAEALSLWRRIGDRIYEAETLFNIGATELGLGEPQKSIEDFNQALAIFRELKVAGGEAKVLSQMAIVYSQLGNFRRAIELNEQAIPLNRSLNNLSEVGVSLNTLGTTYGYLGEPVKSLAYYEEALKIFKEIGETKNVAGVLANLANGANDAGEFDRAFDYTAQALEIHRKIGDRYTEAATLRNYGEFYRVAGDYERALQTEREALEISKAISRRDTEMTALNSLGNIYNAKGEYEKAIENYQAALALAKTMQNESAIATQLNSIGYNSILLGRFEEALDYSQQARELFAKNGYRQGVAQSLLYIGLAYHRKGDITQALENYRQFLAIARQIQNPRQEVNAHYLLALALRDKNELPAALASIENCVRISESMRSSLARTDLRASYFAGNKKFYELYVEILLRLADESKNAGYIARALEAAERSKARTLVELLNESGTNFKAGAGTELIKKETEINSRLTAKAARQTRLLAGGKASPDDLKILAQEISELTGDREKIAAEIRRASPNYSALTQPAPLKLKEIQALLDKDTVLLEYALGEAQSSMWMVTDDSISVYKLPKREEIETGARRFYESLKTAGNSAATALNDQTGTFLSSTLLGPIADRLTGKRVVVVSDGALQYIPFAALPNPASKNQFLIETNEITNLPSATTLAVLRRETAQRTSAPKTLAIFADPVFSSTDPRLKNLAAAAKSPGLTNEKLQRSFEGAASETGEEALKSIPRLPFSRREADAITGNLSPQEVLLRAVDFKASLETVKEGSLAQYKIIHFATHGLLNSKNPELSGLVLSLFNEKGEPEDGFLRLNEIYNLRLNSELVVLSACQTALGREIKGEGLIGLTRGFMYAGSPRVMASLWKVDDAATAELMKRFYQNMLVKNERPAEALRAAQIEMSRDERFKSPYYWAAFTLQGEWR